MDADGLFPHRFVALPIPVRPLLGETIDSYICRLARANHLKPSYLHCMLHGPPLWFGKPNLDWLAALAGRDPQDLQRAFAFVHMMALINYATAYRLRRDRRSAIAVRGA